MHGLVEKGKRAEETIDDFIERVRERQPSHHHVTDAVLSTAGIPKQDLVCLTSLEYDLVVLHSLAARKYELSAESEGYWSWQEAYVVWKEEGHPEAITRRVHLNPLIGREIRRLPYGEKTDFILRYQGYIKWLNEMTGNDNDPVPGDIILLAIGKDSFPEIPSTCRDKRNNTYSCRSLKAACLDEEPRRKAS